MTGLMQGNICCVQERQAKFSFCPQEPLSYCLHGIVSDPEVKESVLAVKAKAGAAFVNLSS